MMNSQTATFMSHKGHSSDIAWEEASATGLNGVAGLVALTFANKGIQ
jgi:hypothetical protein